LDLDDKANLVALTALRLVGRMKRDWIVCGRRPAGICAAALLIAARAHGFSRHPQDVTRILRVCGMTVTTRVREFEQTPSASLTLEQFGRVELENEADPPAFTRNRILEARARAIQENNVKLLTSGALDDPMAKSEKQTSKWRNHATTKNNDAFEKLYKSLEIQMNNKKKEEPNDDEETKEVEGDNDGDDEENGNGNAKGKSEEIEAETQQQTGNELDDKVDEKESLKKDDDENEKKMPATNSDDGEKNMLATNTDVAQSKWDKAYPRSTRFGKKLILPDHATLEERLPPTQPVEGTLDTGVWRKDMPQDMIDDIDSIFRNPTEVAQKEAIFNKINKDYIVVQAQKEKNRTDAEQAHNNAEKDLAEQSEGLERYRKRKGRGKDSTTEEALLEAVANRKISRKINYDAMSSIFDDGSFSTGGATEDPFVTEKLAIEEI
jgi:transcription factor IIIB subunit 2